MKYIHPERFSGGFLEIDGTTVLHFCLFKEYWNMKTRPFNFNTTTREMKFSAEAIPRSNLNFNVFTLEPDFQVKYLFLSLRLCKPGVKM